MGTVYYTVGAPGGSSNPVDYVTLDTKTKGSHYFATCSSISGSSDKKVTVTGTNCTIDRPVSLTSKGQSQSFEINRYSDSATFKFVASASVNCSARGLIY